MDHQDTYGSCYSTLPSSPPPPLPPVNVNRVTPDDLTGMLSHKMSLLHKGRDDSQSRDSGHSSGGTTTSTGSPDMVRRSDKQSVIGSPDVVRRNDKQSVYSYSTARSGSQYCDDEEDSGVSSVVHQLSSKDSVSLHSSVVNWDYDDQQSSRLESWTPDKTRRRLPPPEQEKVVEKTSKKQIVKQQVFWLKRLAGGLAFLFKSCLMGISLILLLLASFSSLRTLSCTLSRDQQINVKQVQEALHNSVFGQHLAIDTIVDALEDFTNSPNNVMVLLLTGWLGTGKTLTSGLLRDHFPLPANVHEFNVPVHFADPTNFPVLDDVVSHIKRSCGPSLVILEDLDDGSVATLNRLAHFVRQLDSSNNGTLVVATTSLGGQAINRRMLELMQIPMPREDVAIKHIAEALSNDDLPLAILEPVLVPFLPLTRDHVRQCIQKEVAAQHGGGVATKQDVKVILEELSFFSDTFPIFSRTGCKRVSSKVDYLMSRRDSFLGLA